MNHVNLEESNMSISRLIYGCSNPIITKDSFLTRSKALSILDAAYELGINTFDLAEAYGQSEVVFGRWLKKKKNRDNVVIITKGCHPHNGPRVDKASLKVDIEQSLLRLGIDVIDIYMLHRDQKDANLPELMEALNEYINKGVIRQIGVSNWTHERIQEANQYTCENGLKGFSFSSPNFGPAIQCGEPWKGCISITGCVDAQRWYEKEKMPVFAYSSLAGGLFSGKVHTDSWEKDKVLLDKAVIRGYWCEENFRRLKEVERIAKERNKTVSQISLAYCLAQKMQVFPIVTSTDIDRLKENAEAVEINLLKKEIDVITGG